MRKYIYEIQVNRQPVHSLEIRKAHRPEQAAEVLYSLGLAEKMQECFYAMHLSVKNDIIAFEMISRGLIDRSHVAVRELFRGAIVNNSSKIIMAHNHPSGDLSPSQNDLDVTRSMREAAAILGIDVVDHLIVAYDPAQQKRAYLSFREQGLIT